MPIPSMQVLRRRGLDVDPSCVVCGEGPETLSHILLHWPKTIHTWGRSPMSFDLQTLCSSKFDDLLCDVLHSLPDEGIIMFTVIAWNLWKARNKRRFES
ncbi:hypothetical protein ACS0TY_013989 [Phlomoides rotata]